MTPASKLRGLAVPGGILAVAVVLQASRLPFRWNQITMAYAAYFREYRRIIELEGPFAALTTFVGIHPPGYSLLFLGLMALSTPPLLWMAVSGLFSVSSAPVIHRSLRGAGGGVAAAAALVLALSPYRNAYGLEINNYPLLVGVTALQWLAFSALLRAREEAPDAPIRFRVEGVLLLATAACVWTHALGVVLPLAQGAALIASGSRGRMVRAWLLTAGGAAVLCLPLLVGALEGAGAPPINDPPGLTRALTVLTADLPARYGPASAAWIGVALALLGFARSLRADAPIRRLALAAGLHCLLGLGLIAGLVALGIAADHQLPYYAAVLPSAALLIGISVRSTEALSAARRPAIAALTVLLTLQLLSLVTDFREAARAWLAAPTDHPLLVEGIAAWTPEASLLLVAFPRHGDDEKDAIDSAWALLPWQWPVSFDDPDVPTQVPADPYFGQPVRLPGDRWLYTFATFDPHRFDLIADTAGTRGQRVVVSHYDLHAAPRETERLEAWAAGRGVPMQRGTDERLWILEPR